MASKQKKAPKEEVVVPTAVEVPPEEPQEEPLFDHVVVARVKVEENGEKGFKWAVVNTHGIDADSVATGLRLAAKDVEERLGIG